MKLDVNGITVHYTIEGEGPWITLSHSLACNLGMWDERYSTRWSRRTPAT